VVAFGEVFLGGGGGFRLGVSGGGCESGSKPYTDLDLRCILILRPREMFRLVILECWCC